MRWKKGRRSNQIEDRRNRKIGKKTGIGGGIILAAIMAFFLKDPSIFFSSLSNSGQTYSSSNTTDTSQYSEVADFVSVVFADIEDSWTKVFASANLKYQPAKLVLYSGQVQSGCGFNSSQTGPFYCPRDQKIYLDLSFLNELKQMGAAGDFAFAYVIAHENGHHISNLIGTLPKVNSMQARVSKKDSNRLSVLLELQADCFAGVWANYASKDRNLLETGDIQEGLQAAAAVGDDALIGNRPDLFTHGTSQQRQEWLSRGLKSGSVGSCDTFKMAGVNL